MCALIADEETVYKAISSSKSLPRSLSNQGRNNSDSGAVLQVEGLQQNIIMPPLYGEEQTPNQNQQSLQTHSNKFPVFIFVIFIYS